MKYTIITKDGERYIAKNVEYIFMNEHEVQLVNDEGTIEEAFPKENILILTKCI